MELSDVTSSLEGISLPAHQKKAVLQLIDAKINNDMREVIAEIKRLESKIDMVQQKLDDKIQMVHDKLSNEIKTIYWVIGIAMTVLLFMISRK
jgi:uncharacterized protein Yka (UPF0111/DUF47 family)